VTSQGQRFRRRALRRGYKVDEVDTFLDRVEATLAGEQRGTPVQAQEVHDVVFRVRFGGYDEWQVDLHLDRVERQLAELEERGGRAPDPRMAPDRMGPDRMGAGMGGERMPPGMGDRGGNDRMGGDRVPPGMGDRMGGMGSPMSRAAPPTERLPAPPLRDDRPMPASGPPMGQRPANSMPPNGPGPDPYGRYDEPPYAQQSMPPPGYDPGERYDSGERERERERYDPGERYDSGERERERDRERDREPERYDTFEPGRHGKADMTAEIRMPERESRGFGGSPMGGPSPMSAPPMPSAPMSGPGGPGGGPSGELYRVDQLRRTFQPRRFGSGYDPMQVDRLFEGILAAMSGRGPMPVSENELDTLQFGLVPGGYFEAEVDAALREVKDILRRR
jgi:DivIVA domain-containing protein